MPDPNPLKAALTRITSPDVLAEIVAMVIAVLIAVVCARLVRNWQKRRGVFSTQPGAKARIAEGAVLLAPSVTALVVMLLVRGVFGSMGMRTAVTSTAVELVTALVLVRLSLYVLRVWLGGTGWLRVWEARIAFIVWIIIGSQLLGWFGYAENTLDAIDIIPGKKVFSLWDLLRGIVVITFFVLVASLIARAIERRVMKLSAIAVSTRIGISKFTYFFLVSLGILLGVNSAGVDITALTVLTGAIGVGLGFGLQAVAGNFVSGFVLLMDKSIKPGDVISFTGHTGTSTDNFGWVQELRGRYVVVRDRDGVETLVPNQNLITTSVINWSYSDQRVRIRVPVMVSYDDDPEIALKALAEAVQDHARILREPAPVTRLMSFEDYGMRLEVRFWIADPMNGVNNVRSDVNRAIWKVFKQYGIKIPVAQRELRMAEGRARPTLG
jgi:small-conductance mechanosensitive channel